MLKTSSRRSTRGLVAIGTLIVVAMSTVAKAQQRFELATRTSHPPSLALRTDSNLTVTSANGIEVVYARESKLDSADGHWLGYRSGSTNQIVRWPADNSGHLQIGAVGRNSITYRPSQMQINALEQTPATVQRPRLPGEDLSPTLVPSAARDEALRRLVGDSQSSQLFDAMLEANPQANQQPEMLRLVSLDRGQAPQLLARTDRNELGLAANASAQSDWWVAPVGNAGMFRIQTRVAGRVHAIGANHDRRLMLQPISQDPGQLWHARSGRRSQWFAFENAFWNGLCLTQLSGSQLNGSQLILQPLDFTSTQLWSAYMVPNFATLQPLSRTISQTVQPNPELPPAQLDLHNSQRFAILVLVGDSRLGEGFETIRIAPGQSVPVSLERDAGATLIEVMEVLSPRGIWERRELMTALPPRALYDLSVYEEHLQSIAIDTTGKSPNPIEDVNYVPRSIGWLPLPAGEGLPATGQLDLFPLAKAANNPGAVRRINPQQFDEQAEPRPLEKILNDMRTLPRKSF